MDNSDTEIQAIDDKKQKRLEHLKAAREKALQVRQANAKEKNRVKQIKEENMQLEKQDNEMKLLEKNKELKEKVKPKPKPEPVKQEEDDDDEPEILVKPKKKTNKKKVILVQSSDDSSEDEKIYMKRVKKRDLFPKKESEPVRPPQRQLNAVDLARMSLFH